MKNILNKISKATNCPTLKVIINRYMVNADAPRTATPFYISLELVYFPCISFLQILVHASVHFVHINVGRDIYVTAFASYLGWIHKPEVGSTRQKRYNLDNRHTPSMTSEQLFNS
jgi:hypothetical protein